MPSRLSTRSFLAPALFLITLGCSKKEAASPSPNTGSFHLDGLSLSCQATTTRTAGSIGNTFYDWLYLDLTPTQTTGEVSRLRLLLYKVPGSAATTYALNNLTVYTGSNASAYNFAGTTFTLTATGDSSYSGRFAGKVSASSSSIPGPYTTIANGIFTTVKF